MARKTKSIFAEGPGAVLLIEEAVHLLRQAPVSTWALYALGGCPWALGFLFFWAHTTWFAPSPATLSWSALGLVALFVLLKTAQAEFCGRLLAQRLGAPFPALTTRRLVRLAVVQTQVQCWGLIALPVALVLSLPFGWAFAYFQTLSVLGHTDKNGSITREAAAEAQRWAAQNHLGLLYLSVIGFAAWSNLGVTFYGVPWLANRLLGIQNMFGHSGWGWLNTTFLMSVTALTWLCVDPLVKAFYVLRVFYGRSQRTGEDLRVDLAGSLRAHRGRVAAALMILVVFAVVTHSLRAAAVGQVSAPARITVVSAPSVDPVALDKSLNRVLERRDFQWQMRLKPRSEKTKDEDNGPMMRFLRRGMHILKHTIVTLADELRRWLRWIRELTQKDPEAVTSKKKGVSAAFLHVLLYALIAAAVILIVVVLVLMLSGRKRGTLETIGAQPVAATKPNLADENVEAAHLPSDGWLALAREQMSKGEWRLALRALYLATLAQLAAEGVVTLVKSKTNLDYERELRRRDPANLARIEGFTTRRREFESVWYGRGIPAEDAVRSWFDELRGGMSL